MIIGIDGNEANSENRVGVGRYAFELLWQFYTISQKSKVKSQNYNLKFKIYIKNEFLSDLPNEIDWWKYKVVGPKKFWTQVGLPVELFKNKLFEEDKVDVFFTPTHYAPRFSSCPRVISIMDLSFLKYPEMFKKNDLWQLKDWTAYSVKKASKILTISKASKDDIIKSYQVPEDKVVVTYPGISKIEDRRNKGDMEDKGDIKRKYGILGDYILSVGTLQPRKNYARLIEAFSKVKSQKSPARRCYASSVAGGKVKTEIQNLKLIIAGKKGWMWEEILEAPKKYGVENEVRFLDYVEDQDLPELYRQAKCFILVSLYEGFGLPVLEAMSYGTPVLASNNSSLPEVVGEAGILVDPENIEEIGNKLLKILRLPKVEREEMIRKGKEQAKKFSWEKCAKETLKVLEEIGGK